MTTSGGAVGDAVRALAAGELVVLPTDTVYGLAADPFVPGATARLFEAKRRPATVELPVLVGDTAQALGLCDDDMLTPAARDLMARHWPGPLTIVVRRSSGLGVDLGGSDATIGLRCPDHPVPRAVCSQHRPLAVTSANLHGRPTPETAAEVAAAFPDVAVVLDAGPCSGSSSTVVDCTALEPRLLREGRLPWPGLLGDER